jgi:cyclic pyranopterin phosphate synthase
MTQPLIDAHGRMMRKLRVQLTDACNFRCLYCMPKDVRFQPSESLLPPSVIVPMVAGLARLGMKEVRLTGGEPLARKEFPEFVEGIGKLGLEKFGLTTNGYWLEEWLPLLAAHGCKHINISIDSLQPERFEAITHNRRLDRVLSATLRAKAMGFPVKINVVLLRGHNDDELADFAAFSARHSIPVRFLEYMKIGPMRERFNEVFLSAGEAIERLRQTMTLTPIQSAPDSTSFSFRTNTGAELGFIASETRPFCGSCSRLRLSAQGQLRACLMSEAGLSLVGVPEEDYPSVLAKLLPMKPFGRLPEIAQPMHQIGG